MYIAIPAGVRFAIFNDLKQAIAADPALRDRVCLLGLAVGNSVEEIETFRRVRSAVSDSQRSGQSAVQQHG